MEQAMPTSRDSNVVQQQVEFTGCVAKIRHHGKSLSFVRLQPDIGDEVSIVFDAQHFNQVGSPHTFPSAKTDINVGDLICGIAQWHLLDSDAGASLKVQSWSRVASCNAAIKSDPSNAHFPLPRRRTGRTACAGWVQCPLCPEQSNRKFDLAKGLKRHLMAKHYEERYAFAVENDENLGHAQAWYDLQVERAVAQGVYLRRSPGCTIPAASGSRHGGTLVRNDGEFCSRVHPALQAAKEGDKSKLLSLLAEDWDPFAANSLDHNGASALDWSAGNGHIACVQLLLPFSEGVQSCQRDGRGPAHWAARHGQTEVLKLLIAQSAHVNTLTTNGGTMMMLACYGGHVETCEILLQLRANLNARNAWDCDAGHFAAMGGSVATCRWLLQKGIAFDRPQCSGHTAVHKAADGGCVEVVKYFLSAGGLDASQMERVRSVSNLPSTLAAKSGHDDCATLLCQIGL